MRASSVGRSPSATRAGGSAAADARRPGRGPVPCESSRILIVDDDEGVQRSLRRILERPRRGPDATSVDDVLGEPEPVKTAPPWRIDVAGQGNTAIGLVNASVLVGDPYALVFVDMTMPPGPDGVETIIGIWGLDPDVHVVLCTASTFRWDQVLQRVGASRRLQLLRKPFSAEQVTLIADVLTTKWKRLRRTGGRAH